MNKFKLGQFALTVTDWSILRPFEPAMPLMELSGKPIENNDPGLGPYSKATALQDLDNPIQLYGIGLRKGHPHVCMDLTRKLVKFVSEEWEDAFKDLNDAGVTVAGNGNVGDVTPNWHPGIDQS